MSQTRDDPTTRPSSLASGRVAIWLLGMALALGVSGDLLLRATPWGLNMASWGLALGVASAAAVRWGAGRLRPAVVVTLLLGEACFVTFAWRDTPFLTFWGAVALVAALSLVTAAAVGIRLPAVRIRDGLVAPIEAGLRAISQAGLLVGRDLPRLMVTRHGRWDGAPAAAVGLILAVPVVVVFGGLLRSADPGFAALTDRWVLRGVSTTFSHIALIVTLSWLTAGFLHGIASRRPALFELPDAAALPQVGFLQIGIPLGALGVMLSVFALVQAEYLFGGMATVLETAGLTVAEYARRGFFELVTVATLVLVLLLGAHAVLDPTRSAGVRRYRMLAASLLVLVAVVMVSAVVRMRLYVEHFGLTEDRLYGSVFMLWLAAVLAWFAFTVLRGRARQFGYGAVLAGFATLISLSALNPHALIVRTNVGRAVAGRELDAAYLGRLSADAVPAIVAAWPALDAAARCEVWNRSLKRWAEPPADDWRSWNVARWRARRAAASIEAPGCGGEQQHTG